MDLYNNATTHTRGTKGNKFSNWFVYSKNLSAISIIPGTNRLLHFAKIAKRFHGNSKIIHFRIRKYLVFIDRVESTTVG